MEPTPMPSAPEPAEPLISEPKQPGNRRRLFLGLLLGAAFIAGAVTVWMLMKSDPTDNSAVDSPASSESTAQTPETELLSLDANHNYGDKYADGLLPVGDKKYSTTAAKKGAMYLCNANFVPESQAGAQTRGPWFVNNNTQWDINKKAAVAGKVMWGQNITQEIKNGTRTITTNALPDHHTGVFPVANSDPAKTYDANPNNIESQSLAYALAANPTASSPTCMGGEVGVMLTGVPLFNAFDAGGRDAGAWEVQDSCDGHPQGSGIYHYHTLSRCIKDVSVQTVVGFALDGFPITGPKVGDKNYLTTDDLDECHGIKSEIMLDGKKVSMYHYVMTQDFPYSVSCFRAKAIQSPGQHAGGQGQGQGTPPDQLPPPGQGPPR